MLEKQHNKSDVILLKVYIEQEHLDVIFINGIWELFKIHIYSVQESRLRTEEAQKQNLGEPYTTEQSGLNKCVNFCLTNRTHIILEEHTKFPDNVVDFNTA